MANLMARRKTLVDSMMRDAIYQGAVAVLGEHGLAWGNDGSGCCCRGRGQR